MRRPLLALLPCAAALVSACGSAVSTSKFTGESRNVAQAVSDFQSDARTHNQAKICSDILASSVVNGLKSKGGDCESAIKHQLDQVDNYDLTVQGDGVKVNGSTATARVKSTSGGKDHIDTLALVKESGRWKLASLGG